jgi:hypothetical protein
MYKDGKVVSPTQAKMQGKFEDVKHHAPWVGITQGMEFSECLEHEQKMRGRASLLDPSSPEALNFNEEQSFKMIETAATNALMYTPTHSVSLGGTAYKL